MLYLIMNLHISKLCLSGAVAYDSVSKLMVGDIKYLQIFIFILLALIMKRNEPQNVHILYISCGVRDKSKLDRQYLSVY